MDIDPISEDELEPFTSPEKNIAHDEQQRYAALQNEIAEDPLIGDVIDDVEDKLLASRVNARSRKAWLLGILPTGAGGSAAGYMAGPEAVEAMDVASQVDPAAAAMVGGFAAFGGATLYAKRQGQIRGDKFNAFVRALDQFDDYRVIHDYEIGKFEPDEQVEDLLWDADTVAYDVRIEELQDLEQDTGLLDGSDDAVAAYREVLDELSDIHAAGVDDDTATGVDLYGAGFLEPFYDDDEAALRAREIQSSGAAQIIKTRETEKTADDENPILLSDHVFRLEIVYNGKTVAKFDGTCGEDYTEIGEPLKTEDPDTYSGSSFASTFEDGVTAYTDICERIGIQTDTDRYAVGITSPGGIPLYARDVGITAGRSAKATGKGLWNAGKRLAKAFDYRQVDQ